MSPLDRLLPRADIPLMPGFEGQQVEWLDGDTRERYRKRGGHPRYSEHDIQYCFNNRGYRCAAFDETADVRLVAVGCSYVLGVGLPSEALFHERFAQRFRAKGRNVVAWNLGASGTSNDYANRILQLAVPLLDPDIVLVNFTHACRREYVSVQNQTFRYYPDWKPPNLVARDIKRHFDGLSSPYDDALNFFRNYRAIAALLADRCWMFSTIETSAMDMVRDHLDEERFAGVLEVLDHARDDDHPGAESHAALEARYWNCFQGLSRKAGGFSWENSSVSEVKDL